jgi:hypothetical protein
MSANSQVYDILVGNDTDLYREVYSPAKAVSSFHTLPRFSHSGDFSLLFSESPEDAADYSKGLLFVACLTISFFTVWGLLLLLFKCLGKKRLGVFSGHPYQQEGGFATAGRVTFLISYMLVFIFSILLVTKGVSQVQATSDTVDATNQDIIKIHDEFVGISTNLKDVAQKATPVRDELVKFLKDDICPLTPDSATEAQVRSLGSSTLKAMVELDNFIANDLKDVDEALSEVRGATEDVDKAAQAAQFTGAGSAAILIPYLIVPSFLGVALIMGWCNIYSEGYYFFITWFILPIFLLMIILAYVAAGFVVLTAEGNADFCSGGSEDTPEASIDAILAQYNQTPDKLFYNVVTFYANQCTTSNPWAFLQNYYAQLTTAKASLDIFSEAIVTATTEQLSQECGADYSPILQLINQLRTHTSILLDSSIRSMELMGCKSIVPLYTTVVYEGTCNTSITAASWIFASFFVIAFFSMVMVMFRGAYYPIYFDSGKILEYGTSDDEGEIVEEGGSEEESASYENEDTVGDDEYTYDQDGSTILAEDENTAADGEYDQTTYADEEEEEESEYTEGMSKN